MTKLLAASALLLIHGPARADGIDYAVGAGARSVPLGASVYGDFGYGLTAWGRKAPGEARYGYVRPLLHLQTSGVVSRSELSLAVHPISFVALQAGHTEGIRLADASGIDCQAIACRGRLAANWFRAGVMAGAGPVVGGLSLTDSRFTSEGTNLQGAPFYDEVSALTGEPGGENLVSEEAFLAYSLDPATRVGAFASSDHMIGSGLTNLQGSLFYRKEDGLWTFTVGAGVYRSDLQALSPTFYGAIRWTGLPSL